MTRPRSARTGARAGRSKGRRVEALVEALVEVRVEELCVDPVTELPLVVLRDRERRHLMTIGVGTHEAAAIGRELEGIELVRPTAHDLLCRLLAELGQTLGEVELHVAATGEGYAAVLALRGGDGLERRIEARPSDGIALALKCRCPILATRAALERPPCDSVLVAALPERVFGRWKI